MIYEFDKFRIDPGKRLLSNGDGQHIPLTPKIFDTLLYLVGNAGKLIGKDELMSAIWSDTVVEENNLNKNISVLRRVLGEIPGEHRFIATVPGTGYTFVADVRSYAAEDMPQGPTTAENEATETPSSDQARIRTTLPISRPYWLAAAVIATLAAVSFLGFDLWREETASTPIDSVAVLPFVNVGGDAELQYLSDGLSETLIDRLSELSQLKVIARSSSFKYRDENIDLHDVARKLGVQAIVTGRVVKRGDDLSIRVELIDARDNKHIWGEQFNRKAADVLEIEGEIARMISGKLRFKLSGEQEQQLAKRGTDDPQAYHLLIKGDFLSGRSATRAKALEHYHKAVELDPNYALAYARLAGTYQNLASTGGAFNPEEVLPKVQAAARKAIELDEDLAEGHVVLAQLARDAWDWKTAAHEYTRALELNPNLTEAHRRYGDFLSDIGRHDQAIAEAERVKELDPQQMLSHLAVPNALLIARRFDESISEIKKAMEMGQVFGAYSILCGAYSGKGQYQDAIDACNEAIRLGGKDTYPKIALGALYARAGRREKAQTILRQLENSKEYVSPGELPILYAALGERDKAFATLERAYAARDLQLQHLNSDLGFDPLRDDPRFKDLLRRVGLPH